MEWYRLRSASILFLLLLGLRPVAFASNDCVPNQVHQALESEVSEIPVETSSGIDLSQFASLKKLIADLDPEQASMLKTLAKKFETFGLNPKQSNTVFSRLISRSILPELKKAFLEGKQNGLSEAELNARLEIGILMKEIKWAKKPASLNQLRTFVITNPATDLFRTLRDWKTNPKGRSGRVFNASSSLMVDFVLYNVILMVSLQNPDFYITWMQPKLPKLEKDEIAVVLTSFGESDPSYTTLATRGSQKDLEGAYKRGTNYFFDRFDNLDDLWEKLESLTVSEKKKIKYLKLEGHGMPGMYMSAAGAPDWQGHFTEIMTPDYLKENQEKLAKLAAKIMAKDAEITFFSCMTGANLNRPMEVAGVKFPTDIGDQFVNEIGKTLLVNGGTLYTSLRPINSSLDLVKAIFDHSSSITSDDPNSNREQKHDGGPNKPVLGTKEQAAGSANRAASILMGFYDNLWKYGFNLKGSLNPLDRIRIDHCQAGSCKSK